MSVRDYPDKYLYCVAFRHNTIDQGSFVRQDSHGRNRIEQHLRCGCEWAVRVLFSMRNVPMGKRIYDKPPGYSPVPGVREAQQEWIRRHPPIR